MTTRGGGAAPGAIGGKGEEEVVTTKADPGGYRGSPTAATTPGPPLAGTTPANGSTTTPFL